MKIKIKINLNLEAKNMNIIKRKAKNNLYVKYGKTNDNFNILITNILIYKISNSFNLDLNEIKYNNNFYDHIKKFYQKNIGISKFKKIGIYYISYIKFFCNPFFRNEYYNNLLKNYYDNLADNFYKEHFEDLNDSSTEKENTCKKYKDNKFIIFDKETKKLIDNSFKIDSKGKNEDNNDVNISYIKKKEEDLITDKSKSNNIKEIINELKSKKKIKKNHKRNLTNKSIYDNEKISFLFTEKYLTNINGIKKDKKLLRTSINNSKEITYNIYKNKTLIKKDISQSINNSILKIFKMQTTKNKYIKHKLYSNKENYKIKRLYSSLKLNNKSISNSPNKNESNTIFIKNNKIPLSTINKNNNILINKIINNKNEILIQKDKKNNNIKSNIISSKSNNNKINLKNNNIKKIPLKQNLLINYLNNTNKLKKERCLSLLKIKKRINISNNIDENEKKNYSFRIKNKINNIFNKNNISYMKYDLNTNKIKKNKISNTINFVKKEEKKNLNFNLNIKNLNININTYNHYINPIILSKLGTTTNNYIIKNNIKPRNKENKKHIKKILSENNIKNNDTITFNSPFNLNQKIKFYSTKNKKINNFTSNVSFINKTIKQKQETIDFYKRKIKNKKLFDSNLFIKKFNVKQNKFLTNNTSASKLKNLLNQK